MHVWKEKKSNQKECGKRCFKSIKGSIKKHPSLYQFCKGKMFIPMNTWIAGKDLRKHCYWIKKDFYSEFNK